MSSNKFTIPKSDLEDTLVYCIEAGKKKGYQAEFKYQDGYLIADQDSYGAKELMIDYQKRFEGMSNPADSMIYFAFSNNGKSLGYYISTYGTSANESAIKLINEIRENETITYR